jgi:hypothetical protein
MAEQKGQKDGDPKKNVLNKNLIIRTQKKLLNK